MKKQANRKLAVISAICAVVCILLLVWLLPRTGTGALVVSIAGRTNLSASTSLETFMITNVTARTYQCWAIVESKTENGWPAFSFGRPLSEIGKEFFVTEKQARLLIHAPTNSNANTWRLTVFYVRAPDWRDKLAEKLGMLLRIVNLDSVADRIPNEKAGHIIHSPEVVD